MCLFFEFRSKNLSIVITSTAVVHAEIVQVAIGNGLEQFVNGSAMASNYVIVN
jgi:hypothetical protein